MSVGSLDGGGVSDGGMNDCMCNVVYDGVSDVVRDVVWDVVTPWINLWAVNNLYPTVTPASQSVSPPHTFLDSFKSNMFAKQQGEKLKSREITS